MGFPIAGGVGLATETMGGAGAPLVPVDYFPGMIRDAAQQAWTQYHDDLVRTLGQLLGKGDLIAAGVTLYDLDIRIAADISLSADRDDNGDLIVHLTTGGCSITATSTQPTALGSWADPRFSFDFALDLTYRIDLPPATGPLTATGFTHVQVLSPHIDSQNLVADIVFVFNDIWGFLSGDNYARMLEQYIAGTDFASYVNPPLAPLNAKLQELAAQGYWFLTAVVDRLDGGSGGLHGLSLPGAPADRLDLMLIARGYDRSGVIEGDITWPAALGRPVLPGMVDAMRAVEQVFADVAVAGVAAAVAAPDAATRLQPAVAAPAGTAFVSVADAVALNPQPLPPGPDPDPVVFSTRVLQRVPLEAQLPLRQRIAAAAQDVSLQQTSTDLRAAVASRFIDTLGADRFHRLATLFEDGPITFTVAGMVTVPGEPGQFASTRNVGHMARMAIRDDDTTCRRHYVLDQVPIDVAMPVTCTLANGWVWSSGIDVACSPDGWDGAVTVHPAINVHDRIDQAHTHVFGAGGIGATHAGAVLDGVHAIQGDAGHAFDQRIGAAAAAATVATGVSTTVAGGIHDHIGDRVAVPVGDQIGQQVDDHGAIIAAALTRHDPSGAGTVQGIDFTVAQYTPPVIR